MRAIRCEHPCEPDELTLGEVAEPICGAGEVLVAVRATAVNRADLLQRRGLYAPPPGASTILGLEAAGEIVALGPGVSGFVVGQPVMALLSGGGYAERVAVPSGQLLPIPAGLSFIEAAAIPEVFLTAFLNLFRIGGLPFADAAAPSARLLVHGGASGVGTAALQLGRVAGVTTYCTVGDAARGESCLALGAAAAWNYHSDDWLAALNAATTGQGVDVVLDCIGGSYLGRNLAALGLEGRLVCIGTMGGATGELDLGLLLRRRLRVIGSTLRALPLARKAELCRDFAERVLPLFGSGQLRPMIDRVLPLAEAGAAHRALDSHHVGKIVLAL